MSSGAELLAEFLAGFEISAFGERLGPELADRAIADHPELASLGREALAALLGGAAAEGVAQLCAAAELRITVEGSGPDPSYEALEATVENVRAALALIVPPPGAEISIEERALRSARAIEVLAQLVASWDASRAGEPPRPGDAPS